MKVYKRLTYVTMVITMFSVFICLWLHYTHTGTEIEFWINVCLALFGSAALTLLTSLLTYFHERQKTLENFFYHTQQIISQINRYKEEMTLEEKLKYFLAYHDMDKTMWNSDFGNMDFFLERLVHSREYIYTNICTPIIAFGNAVDNHLWHFRWHLDGSGKNEHVMQQFVDELEKFIIEKIQFDIPTEWDENNVPTSFCKYTDVKPKLVLDVKKHLAGRYYEIMYGKIKVAKRHKMEEQNGQAENGNP